MPTAGNSGQETPWLTTKTTDTQVLQESSVLINPAEQTIKTQTITLQSQKVSAQPDLLAILLGTSVVTDSTPNNVPESKTTPSFETAPSVPTRTASDLFFIDTTGNANAHPPTTSEALLYNSLSVPAIGEDEEPDEIILVPSPAVRRAASVASLASSNDAPKAAGAAIPPPAVTMETLHLSFSKGGDENNGANKSLKSFSVPRAGRSTRVPLRARKEAKRRPRDEAWTNSLGNVFGFKDGREGLRKGDSDLDVGSDSAEDALDDNGMDVDGDLDAVAMARFAREVNKPQMSMDDVVIEAALQAGEYDSEGGEEDDDDDGPMDVNAGITLESDSDDGDDDDDDDDWSDDDDDDDVDMTPMANFKAKLQRVRERTPTGVDGDIVDRTINEAEMSWADRDEDFIAQIEILDENADILESKKDRKARNALFRAIQNGDADHPFRYHLVTRIIKTSQSF
ncbi:hypothetical protein M408DRAFT_105720 [Serendipita vermifera MAFF 305830]|uniref:Uncharacterized protein n=1 Tax=Serendipita vermifera MAFF 305830 TaxID=933852 RepID=A0A0C3BC54_SERVB|nr:hypothetical protein M408DRAFT_105720 [Serendipita vermifera MAFF 305830]